MSFPTKKQQAAQKVEVVDESFFTPTTTTEETVDESFFSPIEKKNPLANGGKRGGIDFDGSSLQAGNALSTGVGGEEKKVDDGITGKNPLELVGKINDLSKDVNVFVSGGTGGAAAGFSQKPEAAATTKKVNDELTAQGIKPKDIAEIKNDISDLSPEVQQLSVKDKDGNVSYPYSLESLGKLRDVDPIAYKTKLNAVKTYDAIRRTVGTEKANEFSRLQNQNQAQLNQYTDIEDFNRKKEKQKEIIRQTLKGDDRDIAMQRVDENSAIILNDAIPDSKSAEDYLNNRLYQSKGNLTKNHLSVLDSGESEFDGNIGGFTLESIQSKLDPNNPADQIAFAKYKRGVNLNNALSHSGNLDEAALKFSQMEDGHLGATVETLNAGGQELPNSMKGEIVANFLNDPEIIAKAQDDPEFAKEYTKTAQNLYFNYPDYAKKEIGNLISQEREDKGQNNWFANVPTKESTNKLVDEMVANGKMTELQKNIYLKDIAPELGVGKSIGRGFGHILAPAFTDNSPIATPDLLTHAGEGWDNTMGGVYKSLKTLNATVNPTLPKSNGEIATDLLTALKNEHETVSVQPKGLLHKAAAASGDFIPLVVSMAVGGGMLKGAGKAGEAINMALQFAGNNAEKALVAFPDSPLKQKMYTGAATSIDMFLGRLLPHNKALSQEVSNSIRKDITGVISDFSSEKITADAAKKTILNRIEDLVTKKAPGILKANTETGAIMAAFSAGHNGLDIAFGAKPPQSVEDFAKETAQAFETGFLGNTLVAAAMAGKNTATVKDNLLKASANPEHYIEQIKIAAAKNPEIAKQQEELINNVNVAVEARKVADAKGMNKKQTEDFILLHVAQNIQENTAKNATVDLVKEEAEKKAKDLKARKEKVYGGEADTKLSVPIDNVDEQGIPIGDNVPAPTDLSTDTKPTDVPPPTEQSGKGALSDIESTTGALKEVSEAEIDRLKELAAKKEYNINGKKVYIQEIGMRAAKELSEAYHSDKAAGKETELTKAVEEALTPKKESTPVVVDEGVNFKTSKGSEYTVNSDGTTTRNKALRDGDTESGVQSKSDKTYYLSKDDLDKLSEIQTTGDKKIISETNDGKIGVKYIDGKDAGKFEQRTLVTPKSEPEIGLHPLEIWKDGKEHHFGNEITEVNKSKTEVKNEEAQATKVPNPETGSSDTAPTVSEIASETKTAESGKKEPPKEPAEPVGEDKGGNKVGVSHESLTELAKRLKLAEPETGEWHSPEWYAERGRELLKGGADPKEVDNPKNELHDRISIARANLENLVKEADKVAREKGVDSKEYEEAHKEVNDYTNNVVKKLGTKAGQAMTALQGERDIDTDSFTAVRKAAVDAMDGKPLSKEQEAKIKDLVAKNEELKKRADEAERLLIEAMDKAMKEGESPKEKTNIKEKSKKAADIIRKLKTTRPDTFSSGNIVWDSAVEVVAKAVELGGSVADAIAKGIEHIKNSEWYKGLSKEKKESVEKDFTNAFAEEKEINKDKLEDLQKMFVDKNPKDTKFSIDEAKAIWEYAKEQYIDRGISFRDMIAHVAEDLGLTWKQASTALTSKKTERISDEMWKKSSERIKNQHATKNWIEAQNKSIPFKALRKVSAAFRGVSVFGHGGIFIGTHAGMTLFNPSQWKVVIPAFIRGWKFAYGSKAKYERRVEQLRNDRNYVKAQRAGLKNNPDNVNTEEFQKSQKFFEKIGGEAGVKGFNAIKVLRQDLFNMHYDKLSEAEKNDPEAVEQIAKLVNNATGATNLKMPDWVNEVTFAGGMEATRWGKLTRSPMRATAIAFKALVQPEKATTAERVFAKVWGRRVGEQLGTMAGLLLANAAIQNAVNPNNPTNLTDPDKPDYMKFKFGDLTIDPSSGMRGTAMFIYGLGKIPFMSKKERRGDTPVKYAGKAISGYARGKLAPLYGTMADFFDQQDFNRNPMPFSNEKPGAGHHKLTWTEYAWEKAPLPVAHAAGEMYKAALDHNGGTLTTKHIVDGIIAGVLSGGTGFRIGEYNAGEVQSKGGWSKEDLKDPVYKVFADKGVAKPDYDPSKINTKEVNGKKVEMLSDYDPATQKAYTDKHFELYKQGLSDLKSGADQIYRDAKGTLHINPSYREIDDKLMQPVAFKDLTDIEVNYLEGKVTGKATEETKKLILSDKTPTKKQ